MASPLERSAYKSQKGEHTVVRKLLTLQFLPATHIRRTFENIEWSTTMLSNNQNADKFGRAAVTDPPDCRVEDWSVFRQAIRTVMSNVKKC